MTQNKKMKAINRMLRDDVRWAREQACKRPPKPQPQDAYAVGMMLARRMDRKT